MLGQPRLSVTNRDCEGGRGEKYHPIRVSVGNKSRTNKIAKERGRTRIKRVTAWRKKE